MKYIVVVKDRPSSPSRVVARNLTHEEAQAKKESLRPAYLRAEIAWMEMYADREAEE